MKFGFCLVLMGGFRPNFTYSCDFLFDIFWLKQEMIMTVCESLNNRPTKSLNLTNFQLTKFHVVTGPVAEEISWKICFN